MFTGIITHVGALGRRERRAAGYRLVVHVDLGPLALGESIAVNGACLTVAEIVPGGFAADVSQETSARTNLGRVSIGGVVNLERALRAEDRLGGHLVSGHVDGLARVDGVEPVGDARRVTLSAPAELFSFIVPKGSIALDGVSLTVNDVREPSFEVMLVPHTLTATTRSQLEVGRELNLEVDLLARYVVGYLRRGERGPDAEASLVAALKRSGMM